MASSSRVLLTPSTRGEYAVPNLSQEAADTASRVLQENHENFHIFYNTSGFHNHIAHHILTLFAIGASPETILKQYKDNASYQQPAGPLDSQIVEDLQDPVKYRKLLGKGDYYRDFLVFFEKEIESKGYKAVVNDYMLKGDEKADDMLARMYAGFLHPIIHLGFGIEFKQPAIIAEALAMAAVHDVWIHSFFTESEKLANARNDSGKSMVDLLDNIRADRKLSTAAHWDDSNKIRDGIMARAPQEMSNYASQWRVKADELEAKTAEMTNAAVYYTGGAQRPSKRVKFDFYFIHCVNSSIFFSSFLHQPWISTANKVRLLEWKGRLDLCMYASRQSPEPLLDEISNYQPQGSGTTDWKSLFQRVQAHSDDGHAAKLLRALAHAEQISSPYENNEKFRIKRDMWLQLGNMAIDSVEGAEVEWVRSAGFDEAWKEIEDRPRAQL